MAKKKPRSSTDELAVVKAAAWAWYQRGSGSEGKPMGDFDVARTRRVVYKPSRYKLEAMRISEQEEAQAAAAEDSISFWPRHAVVCGTRQDAVMDPRIYGVSRQPEKRAPMVKLATCRPRLTHA
ncbi:hypothetical protein CUMW_076500 [Citrus unshiu]|nr:hypothetical protein CUMW_076500 [Citrus unshiu]